MNSVFVFAPDGLIRCTTIDSPGDWRDSAQADCGICQKLEQMHVLHGAQVVVDSAFGLQKRDSPIKSGQQDPTLQGVTRAKDTRAVVLNCQATSLRQLSGHGMKFDPRAVSKVGRRHATGRIWKKNGNVAFDDSTP